MVESAPPQSEYQETAPSTVSANAGTILEGAFIDPAYSWPPKEGEGKNAIEIVSNETGETEDLAYPEVPKIKAKRRVITQTEVVQKGRCFGVFNCCKSEEAVLNTHTETVPVDPEEKERLKAEYLQKREQVKKKRKQWKLKQKENEKKFPAVPEGVLVYRLDTAQRLVTLISAPSSNTDVKNLITEIVVADASPSRNTNRRGIVITGESGETVELVACEQRTATSWMEAMNMMLGKQGKGMKVRLYFNQILRRKRMILIFVRKIQYNDVVVSPEPR